MIISPAKLFEHEEKSETSVAGTGASSVVNLQRVDLRSNDVAAGAEVMEKSTDVDVLQRIFNNQKHVQFSHFY